MSEYTLASGPLSTFDFLFDPKLERIRDHPAITLTPKSLPDKKFGDYRRDASAEIRFLAALLGAAAPGHHVLGGYLDTDAGKSGDLARSLTRANLRSASMRYDVAEDRLVVFELAPADLEAVWPHYPPDSGRVWFHLTKQIFDVFEVHWGRKAADHRKRPERLGHDILEFEAASHVTAIVDEDGAMAVVGDASLDDGKLRKLVEGAAARAGVKITEAPSLFG
jgi:hypothetical protein